MEHPLYKNKNFIILIIGKGVSAFGSQLYQIALMWYIIDRTGSSLSLGISVVCMTLPVVFLMAPAGVMADKNMKRLILMGTDFSNGILMLALTILLFNDSPPMTLIYICLFLASSVSAFFNPTFSATIPLIVGNDQLPKANASFQLINRLSSILGPAISGMLVAFVSEGYIVGFNAVTFFVSAGLSYLLIIPKIESPERKGSFFSSFVEGLKYTINMRRLLLLIIVGGFIINFFLAPINIYLTIICKQVLKVGSTGLGAIDATISIGALLGSLVIMSGIFKNYIKLTIYGLCLEGIALMIAGIFMNFASLMVFALLLGIGIAMASVGIGTTYQKIIPNEKMGRVSSLSSMVGSCTMPLGTLMGATAILHFSPAYIYLISGIVVAISGLTLFLPFKGEFLKQSKKQIAC